MNISTHRPWLSTFVPCLVLGLTACGSSDTGDTGAPSDPDPRALADLDESTDEPLDTEDAAAGQTDPDGWLSLLTGDWTMPSGEEGYVCARYTVPEDMYVAAFEAINPPGTHHTLLTAGEPDAPDGVAPCDAGTNHLLSLYGSGVGTNPMLFPEGVAVRIEAGTQLLLNLHLFNTGTEPLSGTSGTRFKPLAEGDVVHLAEGLLAGPIELSLPPNQETTQSGHCTMSHDVTVFAVSPHMHQLGTYAKVVAETEAEGEVLLHEGPYDFDEQLYYMIDPLAMKEGDRIRVECTWDNTTDRTVGFGDSSLDEMCFSGVYRYPARDSSFFCFPD